MKEEEIKDRISASLKRLNSRSRNQTNKLRQGQVRLLTSPDPNVDPRYVLILNCNPIQETATVALISNLTNFATERDYISDRVRANSPFDLAILLDFQGTADYEQMQGFPVLGEICVLCCKYLYSNSTQYPNEVAELPINHDCLVKGDFPIQLGDTVWSIRNFEFETLDRLCPVADSMRIAIREAKSMINCNSLEEFISQSTEIFNRDNILQLQDSSLDLIRC